MKTGVLITGGGGLLAVNWAAAVRDRFSVTLGLHSRLISMDDVDCRKIDLETPESICSELVRSGAKLVINCAAMTNVEECQLAPELAYHANAQIARNVAVACNAIGVKLVQLSTDHIFSGKEPFMEEASTICPINVYAKTKAAGEQAVLSTCPDAIIARTNFYGWGLPYRKSFSDVIIEALRSGQEIGLFTDVYFTPILANVLISAVHDLVDVGACGLFNVVGDERLSKYEFGLCIARAFCLNESLIKPTCLADRHDLVPRPFDLSLNNKKLRDTLRRAMGSVEAQLLLLRELENIKPTVSFLN